jgi:hypothetical protein
MATARAFVLARRGGALVLIAACAMLGVPATLGAQPGPDLVDLTLTWPLGSFRSPLVCLFKGQSQRGLRRVVIAPGPRTSPRRVDRLTFHDLEAQGAERCTMALGGDEPNLIGSVDFAYRPSRPHSDTPERDFKEDLRDGTLEFEIEHGRVSEGPASTPRESLRPIDFSGGVLRLAQIRPGSDAARLVADLPGSRRLWLTLEARDGTRVEMPLVQVDR